MLKPYYQNKLVKIYHGDCLDILPKIKKVDLILTDPPYGTTSNKWDNTSWLKSIWDKLNKICLNRTIMFSSQPFTTDLINSNRKEYKHQWIWNKLLGGNSLTVKYAPLKIHEEIIIFGSGKYHPQMRKGKFREKTIAADKHGTFNYAGGEKKRKWNDKYYPTSIIEFSTAHERVTRKHPTQKPVELLCFLVNTYSDINDMILDPFLGSGTTAVGCMKLKRKCIGIEIGEKWCEIAAHRCELVATGKTRGKRDLKGRRTLL